MITATQVIEKISTESSTFSQLNRRMRVLKGFIEKRLYGSAKVEDLTPEDQAWLGSLDQNFISNFTPQNSSQIFENIEEEILKISPLVVYIPFEMPAENLSEFGSYLKGSFGSKILFELRYDPTLIAGCALVWKGQLKDYSLRARISESKKEIFSTFKSYLK